jgi:hypothetical protein
MRTALVCLSLVGALPLHGNPFVEQVRIDRGITEVTLGIESTAGPLAVASGPTGVITIKGASPHVSYKRNGDEAKLEVDGKGPFSLELPRQVIFDIDIEQASGPLDLEIDGLRVRDLKVENGEKATVIRAVGPLSDLETIELEQIGGTLALQLGGATPELTIVEIEAHDAAVNIDLSGGFVRLRELSMDGGSGPVTAKLTGAFAKLEKVEVDTTTGSVALDLSGVWTGDSIIWVETTDGGCEVKLPADVGVIVYPSTGSGETDLKGLRELKREENRDLHKSYRRMILPGESTQSYVNSAYGTAPVTLTLDLNTTTGDIRIHE